MWSSKPSNSWSSSRFADRAMAMYLAAIAVSSTVVPTVPWAAGL
jgi:hypothetical protein